MQFKTAKGSLVDIEDQKLGGGGQGTIHMVINPSSQNKYVAKIFHDSSNQQTPTGKSSLKSKQLEDKVKFMIANNPFVQSQKKITDAFAWPVDVLYDTAGQFQGYIMPLITDSITAVEIVLGIPMKPNWQRFGIKHSNSYNTRIKLCYNIAQALNVLHESGFYTMVDMKPDNIMLKDNGFVSMIDLDSIQISQNKRVLHFANVNTDEYSPPEHHNGALNYNKDYVDPSWDIFSFAVIAYKLLFNIHPYGGISHKNDPNLHTQEQFIAGGYFAHGRLSNELSTAPPHKNFRDLLPDPLKDLFLETFDEGHRNPQKRPTALKWRDALLNEISRNKSKNITAGKHQPQAAPTLTLKRQTVPRTHTTVATTPPTLPKPAFTLPPIPVQLANQTSFLKETVSLQPVSQQINRLCNLKRLSVRTKASICIQKAMPMTSKTIRIRPNHSDVRIKPTIKMIQ